MISEFTSPEWEGISSKVIDVETERLKWALRNGLNHEVDLESLNASTGLPLLFYYAFDLEPEGPISFPVDQTGSECNYQFFAGRNDVTYFVEVSNDLEIWTTDGIQLSELDIYGMRMASVNLNQGRCFVRFRFELSDS